MHFDAFFTLLFSLEKWVFLGFLRFWPQPVSTLFWPIFSPEGAFLGCQTPIFAEKKLKIFFRISIDIFLSPEKKVSVIGPKESILHQLEWNRAEKKTSLHRTVVPTPVPGTYPH